MVRLGNRGILGVMALSALLISLSPHRDPRQPGAPPNTASVASSRALHRTPTMLKPLCVLLAGAASIASAVPQSQVVFGPMLEASDSHSSPDFQTAIAAALEKHADPVEAMISLDSGSKSFLSEPRLLHVFGEDEPRWLTEGDKLRLRKERKKFADITDHEDFYANQVNALAGKASGFHYVY